MIEVDGSQKSGSGTILRLSIALAAITRQSLHIYNIRQNRPQPGLRPQHLEAVLTAARLCDAKLKGAEFNSQKLWFTPGVTRGGKFEAEIGTAGSIPLLIMTVLPICIFAEEAVQLHISKGGTDVQNSPTINYLRFVFLRALKSIEVAADLAVHRYGYYPKGMGEVTLNVKPNKALEPIRLESFGKVKSLKGISVCTSLAEKRVAERQAEAAINYLKEKGYTAEVQIVNDRSNPIQRGSSLILWVETDTGVILGADAIGEIRKPSEAVGREAAEKLYTEISCRPTVDIHLADMLVPYMALANGKSCFLTRFISDHLETNIWLTQKILKVKFNIKKINGLYRVEKVY